jgi:hypothetical protein
MSNISSDVAFKGYVSNSWGAFVGCSYLSVEKVKVPFHAERYNGTHLTYPIIIDSCDRYRYQTMYGIKISQTLNLMTSF